MQAVDYDQLIGDIKDELTRDTKASCAIIGHTPLALDLLSFFKAVGATDRLLGIYDARFSSIQEERSRLKPLAALENDSPNVAIVAADIEKEELIEAALPFLSARTKLLLAGYGHFNFRDDIFEVVTRDSLVPSLANGYPNSLIHLYQCLCNAARLDLDGVVAEFGMFKGGTTMLLCKFIEHLGRTWKVIAFDAFSGFPPRRSALDMYAHPGCVFTDERSVRQYLMGRNAEIITGDIVDTVLRLHGERMILSFVDTDNYTSATAVLDQIQERTVVGGAIVFDHFTGRNRFRYTLGERMAAKRLLNDKRYFNLHDTGVFFRQL